MQPPPTIPILGMEVSCTSYTNASSIIQHWAQTRQSRYVCVACVNNVMESHDSPTFKKIMNEADLVTPDGMPVVWSLRLLGYKQASRVYGPDLTPILLKMAEENSIKVGFYGGAPEVLQKLLNYASTQFPRLTIAYSYSPPYRPLTQEEDQFVTAAINQSDVGILFIGLNTPKQDYWMAAHRSKIQSVMVGVGAAFDFLSGAKPQAPRWMMGIGLEWLFRLVTEPRRLWKRYLKHNPRFVLLLARQLCSRQRRNASAHAA